MDLEGIIAIAGKPGLFKILSRSQKGLVVESLLDGKKMPALATHKISALEDISMYTYSEDVPLKEILPNLYKELGGKKMDNPKGSGAELEALFEKVLPEYDKERVYTSDLKKLFSWYNLLLEKGYIKEEPKAKKAKAEIEEAEVLQEDNKEAKAKPAAKKPAAKKAAAKPKEPAKKTATTKEPAKKASPKKSKDDN